MKAFFREILVTLSLSILIFLLLRTTIQSISVVGPSMEPNFENGQRLLVNKLVYRLHGPQRGDVIVFYPPVKPEAFIKRVIGLPGDIVEVRNRVVYLNGKPQDETAYIKNPPRDDFPPYKVPPGAYFVLGDNRTNSDDSRRGWVVSRHSIIGKAWVTIWPPDRWGRIPAYTLDSQAPGTLNTSLSFLDQSVNPVSASGGLKR